MGYEQVTPISALRSKREMLNTRLTFFKEQIATYEHEIKEAKEKILGIDDAIADFDFAIKQLSGEVDE